MKAPEEKKMNNNLLFYISYFSKLRPRTGFLLTRDKTTTS